MSSSLYQRRRRPASVWRFSESRYSRIAPRTSSSASRDNRRSTAERIRRRFGVKDALDYLVGEKLRMFAGAARHDAAFARELPRFLAAIWRVFNEYELAGYVAMQKPTVRRQLRALLYFS